jgi:hypothetical protein
MQISTNPMVIAVDHRFGGWLYIAEPWPHPTIS